MKHFKEQAFLHDLYHFDWGKIYLIPEVESAWNYFYVSFTYFINKHALLLESLELKVDIMYDLPPNCQIDLRK